MAPGLATLRTWWSGESGGAGKVDYAVCERFHPFHPFPPFHTTDDLHGVGNGVSGRVEYLQLRHDRNCSRAGIPVLYLRGSSLSVLY